MNIETVKLNKAAMSLVDENCFAAVLRKDNDDDDKELELDMLAYSGGIIKGHWYWGDLSIDLDGMAIPKKKIPILEDHNTSLKIGFATKFTKDGNKLQVVEAKFVDTPESIKFRETSAQGFPYEASIYAKPSQIQTLAENEVADVNGYKMKGPGTIWRKCELKEASICTFGYDSNTRSKAMAESDEELTIEYMETKLSKEEKKSMDINQLKKDHPELVQQLSEEITATVSLKFSEEKSALEAQLASVTEQNTKLSEENKGNEKRILALEKADAIRAEQALKHTADSVFAEKFKEAGLPDRLSAKVRKLVGHEAFVAEGTLDVAAFSAAIDAELKDWSNEDGTVLGFSTSNKSHETENKDSKVVEDTAARMLSHLK